jgi:L-lysine exporter family protein LysE/ArgO
VLSALLFAYFSYSVIVNGYHDLIVQTSQVAS